MPTIAPYGSWASPISAEMTGSAGITISQSRYADGDLFWLEARPAEGGRVALVRRDAQGRISDVTPPAANARSTVHEYGGGAYLISEGVAFYSNFEDQRLYGLEPGGQPRAISPEPARRWGLRYADGQPAPGGRWIAAVQEKHYARKEASNTLVVFPPEGGASPRSIVRGADFYAHPRFSPDGTRLAWLQWNHPNMPWDGTELWVADFAPASGQVSGARRVVGGPEESIFQPEWSPGGELHFISDRSGWWNLYRESDGQIRALAPMEAEFGAPQWVFGLSRYCFLKDDSILCTWSQGGYDRLGMIRPGSSRPIEIRGGYLSYSYLCTDGEDRLCFLGGSATAPSALVEHQISTGLNRVIRRAMDMDIDHAYVSAPRSIEFPTEKGLSAHALFYAPSNRDFRAPADEKPPLIVMSHGGPTSSFKPDFSLATQYWTSRGFAVVQVNYGGSTGYGRDYRLRLNGQWGLLDVHDCVNAAKYLAAQGEIDEARVAIRGGSAGGYTTLCALTFTDTFKAGASYYGIGDMETMVRDTHKFESRYCDMLVAGRYPAPASLIRERSPIHFTDRISAPMILFQGLEDRIVPPNQAEAMVEALKAQKLPYAYIAYEGEQHGFRKAGNIQRSNEAELYFYSRIFGFEPADRIEPVEIANLPA